MNKQSRLPLGSVIGILGGGQLGRMLSLSASQLGFKTHIYDPDFNAPAKQVTNLSSTFKYDDINNLKNFAKNVDVITYEFENIPLDTIRVCQEIKNVYPIVGITVSLENYSRVIELYKMLLNKYKIDAFKARFASLPELEALLLNFVIN